MNPLVSRSATVYRRLVRLYPNELRRRWEREIGDTFALQIADALRERQWTAMIAIWYYALVELLLIALVERLARGTLALVLAALTGASAVFYGLLWALANPLTLKTLYHHGLAKFGG
jgi:hypothetical protein